MPRSQLTDEEYTLIEPLLPAEDHGGRRGRPFLSHRNVLEAIFWIHRTGAPWRDLPEEYGNWSTAYERFRRWRRAGLFQKILDVLQAQGRKIGKIDFDFSSVDGSTVRAHKSAAGAEKKGLRRRKAKKHRP